MIEEKNPLKQGLKHTVSIYYGEIWDRIEEKNPLKQGLKLADVFGWAWWNKIEEKNPLKQGLKQQCP